MIFTSKVPVDTKLEKTEATVSNILIYFAINDLEQFIKRKHVAYITLEGNTICFQGLMDVGQFQESSSLFVERVSSVVQGLSPAEIISHGEVGKVLRANPTTTTLLCLPEGMLVSPTYFNKTTDNNKLEISVFHNKENVMNPYNKTLLLTQRHIFGLICVTVDGSYSVYKEAIDNNHDNKELNQVMGLWTHCSPTTNSLTNARKVHYNSLSHSNINKSSTSNNVRLPAKEIIIV